MSAWAAEWTLPRGLLGAVVILSDVGVVPTARRRGLLHELMDRCLLESKARGDACIALNADSGTLYRRYGFAPATYAIGARIAAGRTALLEPIEPEPGTVEMLSDADVAEAAPALYDLARLRRVGEVERPASWWTGHLETTAGSPEPVQHAAVVRDSSIEGICSWRRRESIVPHELVVLELIAADDAAERSLLRLLAGTAGDAAVVLGDRPVDDVLVTLLDDVRAYRPTAWKDQVWLRLVDVPAALERRPYRADGEVVLEISDARCPWNAGRISLVVEDGRGITATTSSPAAASLSSSSLAAAYLGGTSFAALERAGQLVVTDPSVLGALDELFSVSPAPYCSTTL